MQTIKRLSIYAAAIAALVNPFAPAYSQDAAPIALGCVLPTTTSWGQDALRGVNLGIKHVNTAGGVNQQPIKVITYDDLNKVEDGVAAVERLISRDNVKIVMCAFSSSVAMAEQTVSQRHKKLHIMSFVQADDARQASHPLAFFLNATAKINVAKYLDYVAKDLKPRNVVILADTSDFGQSYLDGMKQSWSKAQDPQILAIERFDLKQTDLSPQLTKVRSLKADAVFIAAGTGEAVANVLQQMSELKVTGLRLTPPGIISESFLKLAGKSAEGLINGDFYFYEQENAANKAFVDAFRAEYKYNPGKLEMIGYESVQIAAETLRKAGAGASDEVLAKTLRENTWTTPRGTWKFTPMGKAYQAEFGFTLLTVKDGKLAKLR